MTDLASVLSQNIASLMLPPSAAGGEMVVLSASILALPDKIEALTRQLQISGSLIALLDTGEATFQTAGGNIKIALTAFTEGKGPSLRPLLAPFLQTQKPMDLLLKPGTPPLAFLGLPTNTATPQSATVETPSLAPLLAGLKTDGLAQGTGKPSTLLAIVLPTDLRGNLKTAEALPTLTPPTAEKAAITGGDKGLFSLTHLKAFFTQAAPIEAPSGTKTTPPLATPTTASPKLEVGSEVRIKLAPAATPSSPQQIGATILSHGPEGQSIVDTGNNLLYVRETLRLPVGTRVMLEMMPLEAKSLATLPETPNDLSSILQKVVDALRLTDPALAHRLLQTRAPQQNTALSGALLFLFSAFQQGDIRSWIGAEAMNHLVRSGKQDFIDKMTAAFQETEMPLQDPSVGTWRSWVIPFGDPSAFSKVQIAVHQEDKNASEGDNQRATEKHTRFLINVQFTRLGAIQMDGLARPKKLDLILRSEAPLPIGLSHELRALYTSTLEAVALTGTIGFQTGREKWITLREAAKSASTMV